MKAPLKTRRPVIDVEELRNRLREAEETLSAIRNGEVDSLIVAGPNGEQVFSLKGAEQPYREFVEQMREGAVTLTVDGTILYINRRFAEMLKLPLEKVIGLPLRDFVRPADHPALAQALSANTARAERFALQANDGSLIPAQFSFSPLPIDDVDAISLVVTDLTEQEEKRELTEALTSLRLAQEQLQRQNKELDTARAAAEAASDAKDNFLAALSHELRTPLTPVLMTVTALESDSSIPALVRRDLSLIRRNVELEARLIDDLLDLTRIVHGKVDLHIQPMDVHTAIAAAIEIAQSEIEAKNIQLVQEFAAAESNISGDPVRIQQLLWNLIRNAAKFTPVGGRITVRSENPAEGSLRITIIDTGIGIDPNVITRIFTPFEQADRSVTRQFGGLGLGLAISSRLAQMHGGTIEAESDGQNKGATFTLTLPTICAQSQPSSDGSQQPSFFPQKSSRAAKRLRILLVEDHEDTRRSITRLLGRDHDVLGSDSVATALGTASANEFDLVISDLGLPDGSGLDLMRKLRDQYGLSGICLSGYGMDDDRARSADAGFQKHLTKPIDILQLELAIAEFDKR